MGEIEIGEYIRTKKGYLGKYQKSVEGFDEFTDSEGTFMLDIEDIVKHSKNIIDLLEVGDYVNGKLVIEHAHTGELYVVYDYVGGKGITTCEGYYNRLKDEEIENVVTKEQFSQIEYRLEG